MDVKIKKYIAEEGEKERKKEREREDSQEMVFLARTAGPTGCR